MVAPAYSGRDSRLAEFEASLSYKTEFKDSLNCIAKFVSKQKKKMYHESVAKEMVIVFI